MPLVEDLKTLCDIGVDVFDVYRKENFNSQTVLMWAISYFPAYRNLSECTFKGYYGYLICGINICVCWLPYSRKMLYISHRQFFKNPFKPLSSAEILNLVIDIDTKFGKKIQKK